MIDVVIIIILVIILIIIISLTIYTCCHQKSVRIDLRSDQKVSEIKERRTNNYTILVEQKKKPPVFDIQCQTDPERRVHFEEEHLLQHYQSLPIINTAGGDYQYQPLPPFPYPTAPEPEVEDNLSEETETEKGEAPEEELESNKDSHLNNTETVHTVSTTQLQNTVSHLETAAEILIHRIASIENRLRKNNIF